MEKLDIQQQQVISAVNNIYENDTVGTSKERK